MRHRTIELDVNAIETGIISAIVERFSDLMMTRHVLCSSSRVTSLEQLSVAEFSGE